MTVTPIRPDVEPTDDPTLAFEVPADFAAAPPIAGPPPAAPYGMTRDGKPRGKPGPKGGAAKKATSTKTPAGPPAPKPPAGSSARKSTGETDYRPGLGGLFGTLIGGIATAGLMKGDPALIADAAAGANVEPVLSDMLSNLANQYTVVAAVLDKVLTIGPYAGGAVALVTFLGQVAVNHKRMPPGLIPGTMPADKLAADFVAKQVAENPQFRAVVEFVQSQRAAQPAPSSAA